jgi:hypothetical protein
MNSLSKIEQQVGPVGLWPTYILLHVFVDKSSDVTLKKMAAFFCGNGVDKQSAMDLVANYNTAGTPHMICDAIDYWYITWERHPRRYHLAHYYNMGNGKVMWLNGKDQDQMEFVEPEVEVPQIGVDCMKDVNHEIWCSLKCAIQAAREEYDGMDIDDDDVDIFDEKLGQWINASERQ